MGECQPDDGGVGGGGGFSQIYSTFNKMKCYSKTFIYEEKYIL